jgi:hypothetical protein
MSSERVFDVLLLGAGRSVTRLSGDLEGERR